MKFNDEFQDSQGNTIRGLFSTVDDDKTTPLMILVHGFTIDKNVSPMPELESVLNKKGISTFRIDLFGHGDSDGLFEDITISKGVDCVLQAIRHVDSLGFENIGLLGESFGGHCSILAASQTDKLKVLCLKSAVSDYIEVERRRRTPEVLQHWEKTGVLHFVNGFGKRCTLKFSFEQDIFNHNAYKAAEYIVLPTFVAHGADDTIVPPMQSKKLATILSRGELHIYPNTEHHYDDEAQFNTFLEESTDFIVRNF